MSATPALQHICDGCGAVVSPEHVRERIARLELATRFRPLHINILLLAWQPPPHLDDYFYFPQAPRTGASPADCFFGALMAAAEISPAQGRATAESLADFQRHGIFLAEANECPSIAPPAPEPAASQLAATLERRIRFSYKPKALVLLDSRLEPLAAALGDALRQSLRIANNARAVPIPENDEWDAFAAALGSCIRNIA